MKNEKLEHLKAICDAEIESIAKYNAAEAAGDNEGCKAAMADLEACKKAMEEVDDRFRTVYLLYRSMKERGNDMIDFNEPYQYRNAAETVELLREYGIEKFSFSSGWSSAIECAWEFVQNGCELAGITEVHGTVRDFYSDEYKLVPAYIFNVK